MGQPIGFNLERLKIAFDIANALTYLHSLESKVLHRDLKSHNVILNSRMEVKMADFGIFREQGDEMTVAIGTTRWMTPEVMPSDRYDESMGIFLVLSELDTLELLYASHTVEHGQKLSGPALLGRIPRGEIMVRFTEKRKNARSGGAGQRVFGAGSRGASNGSG